MHTAIGSLRLRRGAHCEGILARLRSRGAHCARILAVEVQVHAAIGSLRLRSMHTAIGSLRLRSRGAHCDRILAVGVQGCTLRSGACQTRSAKQIGEADWRRRLAMKIGDEDWR